MSADIRLFLVVPFLLICVVAEPLLGGVIHLVATSMELQLTSDEIPDQFDFDSDLAFSPSLDESPAVVEVDIDGDSPESGLSYGAHSAVGGGGGFGSTASAAGGTGRPGQIRAYSEVIVATDEYANLASISRTAVGSLSLADGILLVDDAVDATASYELYVLTANLGPVAVSRSEDYFYELFSVALFVESFYSSGQLVSDSEGNLQFTSVGADLGATFGANQRMVEFPGSPQTFELGSLAPGDRIMTYAYLRTEVTLGGGRESFAGFGDPGQLLAGRGLDVTLQPIPEPGTAALLIIVVTFLICTTKRLEFRR